MAVPLKAPGGAVVQQPGGGLAYGAEEEGLERQPLYVQPYAQGQPGQAPPGEGQAYQPPIIHRAPPV